MLKKCFVAAAILMANPAFASAQDIFWSFSPTELITTSSFDGDLTGSAYIFSDQPFGFDALDLEFTTSDSDLVRFTGGEAFDAQFFVLGITKFDFTEVTVDADGSSGRLFAVNVTQSGVNPALSALFDPDFVPGVGPNGAVLLARVDFEMLGGSNFETAVDLEFTLGDRGAILLPQNILNPSFGSATVDVFGPLTPYCPFAEPDEFCIPVETDFSLGDVNLSGIPIGNGFIDVSFSVDLFDIAPFIGVLASGGYQREADCNEDGLVNFFDIAPFIEILSSDQGHF